MADFKGNLKGGVGQLAKPENRAATSQTLEFFFNDAYQDVQKF